MFRFPCSFCSFRSRARDVARMAICLFLIGACAGCGVDSDSVSYPDTTPTLSDDELPTPEQTTDRDTTDYVTLATSDFAAASPAPSDDFSYEKTDDGLILTDYHGDGGVVVIPKVIDGLPVVALSDELFRDNTALCALSIPDSVRTIGENLLTGCRSLRVLQTPQLGSTRTSDQFLAYLFGGTTPQNGAFKIGSALDTVILTGDLDVLDSQAFYSCYRLMMILLPDSLEEIGSFALAGCTNLKYVKLPDTLRVIGDGAFYDCETLGEMVVPDAVTRIGLGAFAGCSSLTFLDVPFVGESANTNNHIGYIFGAEVYTFQRGYMPTKLRHISVRHGDIPDYAFYECDHLYQIDLPSDCSAIGVRAFHDCASLLSITLPDGVTTIADMAFSDCRWLSTVHMGSSVREIGMQAFMNCINLTELTLPQGITKLAPSLFANCKRLVSVTVGGELTHVGAAVFRHCISLTAFQTEDHVPVDANAVQIEKDNDALIRCGVLSSSELDDDD